MRKHFILSPDFFYIASQVGQGSPSTPRSREIFNAKAQSLATDFAEESYARSKNVALTFLIQHPESRIQNPESPPPFNSDSCLLNSVF